MCIADAWIMKKMMVMMMMTVGRYCCQVENVTSLMSDSYYSLTAVIKGLSANYNFVCKKKFSDGPDTADQ